ncbi:class I adenylate-forming enzyme family protein [Sabulicella rubraurantiaca]|uniref:class I adenylate-forming enzyme family protein n=1 Tax=Sabulicella rubraurantiaca TaxID=2811429 RepID=UPI001A969E50|nr:AMP-binding protein [Sabulicella rubraurantiaca]
MNLARLLDRAGRVASGRVAMWRGTEPVATHAELASQAAALAGGIRAHLGLPPGERVALLMTNGPETLPALFACWQAGLVAVPVNAKLHAREVAFILEHSGARLLFTTPDLAGTAQEAVSGLLPQPEVIEAGGAAWRALLAAPVPPHPLEASEPAWLFYTSGTTGRPKGAILSHRNLLAMTQGYFTEVDSIAPGDAVLHAAPMSHGSGLYALPHVAAMAGQILPESGGFDPEEILRLLAHHRGVTIFAAPTMVGRLVRWPGTEGADLSGLKTVVYGGGPMYLADCQAALRVLGPRLVQIYGQGESPMTITVLPRQCHVDIEHPRYLERLASVGFAQAGIELRVAAQDGSSLPPGETGEVIVRAPTVMEGYWRNPEATAASLRDGWLWTGDMGSLDEDGFLTLKDRSKDLIISGGSNIYPREVEEVLLLHPEVAEVSVVGRPQADWGEEVVAFVVAAPGTSPKPEALDALCLERIARFKRPKEYRVVPSLPKNNYGKVLKTELRRWLERG